MNWAVYVRGTGFMLAQGIDEAVQQACDLGLEVAAVVPDGVAEEVKGTTFVRGAVVVFRRAPRGGASHVTATLVDRNGYPR